MPDQIEAGSIAPGRPLRLPQGWTIQAADNSPDKLTFSAPVDLQAAAGEGKRPTFEMVAYTGIPMNAMGFYSPVIVELSGVKTVNAQIPILLDHDTSKIIGQGSAKIDTAAIRVAGSVMGDDADSLKVVTLAKNGFKWQASIGATVTRREFVESGVKAIVNGREVVGPIVIARESVLQEVSFVAIGADQQTSAAVAASLSRKGNIMGFEAWLQAKGFDPAALSEGQKATLKAAFEAENKPAAPVAQPVIQQTATPPTEPSTVNAGAGFSSYSVHVAEARQEQARQNAIAATCRRFLTEHPMEVDRIEAMTRLAMEQKQSPNDFELDMLRAFRNGSDAIVRGRRVSPAMNNKVIEAAIAQATNLKNHEKMFDDQTLQAARDNFKGGIGLQQLLGMAAKDRGYESYSVKADIENVLEAALPRGDRSGQVHASGASSISLPNILSNYANKALIDAFNAVESAWRQISEIRPLSDFKQITIHSLTGDLELEKVGANGEIAYGSLGEETYNLQADTYGKIVAISRKDIINDDLGAFASVPRKLGRGSALKINSVFWATFMANSTFFTSARGNYDDGTDTVLDSAGIKAAMAIWDALTDPDGKPMGSSPRYLLVPPGQWEPGMRLMNSTINNTGGSSTAAQVANANVWAGMFEVVKSKYLNNSSFTGYSALAWYLLCDPADIPVISTGFLNGRDMPYIEQAQADFDTLGVKMRAYHDFGCALQEYRGGCKFKGEA